MTSFNAGAGAGAAATAIADSATVRGLIVKIEPDAFLGILARSEDPLVVHGSGGWFSSKHRYLHSYRGLGFACISTEPLDLPAGTELVFAKRLLIPA